MRSRYTAVGVENTQNTRQSLKASIETFPALRFSALNQYIVLTLALFVALQATLYWFKPTLAVFILLNAALCIAGIRIRRDELPPVFSIIYYAVVAIFTFYAIAAYPPLVDAYQQELSAMEWFWLMHGSSLVLALTALSFYRPIFGLCAILYVQYKKYTFAELFHFVISGTDYMAVIEVGQFLACGLAAYGLLTLLRREVSSALPLSEAVIPIILFAIAAHFANYFFSAYAKMVLDANPFAWALHNNTHYVMIGYALSGMVPLSITPEISALSHRFVDAALPLLNWSTLIVQTAAIIGLWRIRWAIILTALYDVTHVIIFLVTGIFFWKWILLNFAIIAGLSTIKHYSISLKQALVFTAFTLLSPLIFNTTYLGWWDTASFNKVYFTAVTHNGETYEVPSNYFLAASVSVAQQKRVGIPYIGHYELDAAGAIPHGTIDDMHIANRCELQLGAKSEMQESVYQHLQQYVRRHHQYIVEHSDADGRYPYDWYPHHIWTMPWEFSDFHQLDKRRIDHYVFHVVSGCKTYEDGIVGFEEALHGTYPITLPSTLDDKALPAG